MRYSNCINVLSCAKEILSNPEAKKLLSVEAIFKLHDVKSALEPLVKKQVLKERELYLKHALLLDGKPVIDERLRVPVIDPEKIQAFDTDIEFLLDSILEVSLASFTETELGEVVRLLSGRATDGAFILIDKKTE